MKVLLLKRYKYWKRISIQQYSFHEKNYNCFIGYLHDDYKVKSLHKMFPKTKACVKTKWMYFLIEDDDLLEKYNAICNKISTDI